MRTQTPYLAADGLEYKVPYRQSESRPERDQRDQRESPFYGFTEGCALEDCPRELEPRRRR